MESLQEAAERFQGHAHLVFGAVVGRGHYGLVRRECILSGLFERFEGGLGGVSGSSPCPIIRVGLLVCWFA